MRIFVFSFLMAIAIISLLLISKLAWRIALDTPNHRSLHSRPTPKIGGWAVLPAAILVSFAYGATAWRLTELTALLFLASYLDDRRYLPILLRLMIHTAVATAWLVLEPTRSALSLVGIGPLALAVIAVVWWCNLYNFMDGADGLAGGMALIGFLAYGATAYSEGVMLLAIWSWALAGASAGFLLFNFHPARIFLGDAGSIPLGFLVGALGLWGWSSRAWPSWFPFVVFAPFFLDATVTLLRRMITLKRFWQSHNEHYYQRMIRSGWSHRRTVLCEYLLMIACAILATTMLSWSKSDQYTGLLATTAVFIGLAILVDLRWARFQKAAKKLPQADSARSTVDV